MRYIVIRTGKWLVHRSVLLSPAALSRVHDPSARFVFRLTQAQIKNAPSIDLARPVSQQWEAANADYYGFAPYWIGPTAWGEPNLQRPAERSPHETGSAPAESAREHLRSANEVAGYHVEARDGEIGHVEDLLVHGDTWAIRYLLVDTSNWLGGRMVIIAPDWADRIDWPTRHVLVDVERHAVESSPEFEPGAVIADMHDRPVRVL